MKKGRTLRYPVVSGLFYPDKKKELEENVDSRMSRVDRKSLYRTISTRTGVQEPAQMVPRVLISPHAGYIFSASVQACSFAVLENKAIETVVVVGPAHQMSFRGISINVDGAYETPLGEIEVDLEVCEKLISFDTSIHTNQEAHLGEHSIEVQLPFIQRVLPRARIVPVLFGDQNWDNSVILKDALSYAMKESSDRYTVIASSDLSHYHTHVEAEGMDKLLMKDLQKMDPESFYKNIQEGNSEACGFGGILTGMMLAKETGKGKSAVLRYMDSGDVSGDRKRVVGYLSAVMY